MLSNRLLFAAMHESGYGTSRHFAATQQFSRFRSEADIQRAALTEPISIKLKLTHYTTPVPK
jgi:hypothetical protein